MVDADTTFDPPPARGALDDADQDLSTLIEQKENTGWSAVSTLAPPKPVSNNSPDRGAQQRSGGALMQRRQLMAVITAFAAAKGYETTDGESMEPIEGESYITGSFSPTFLKPALKEP